MKHGATLSSLIKFNAAKPVFFQSVLLSLLVLTSATALAGVEFCPTAESLSINPVDGKLNAVPGWSTSAQPIGFDLKGAELKTVTIKTDGRFLGDAVSCFYGEQNKTEEFVLLIKGTGLNSVQPDVPSQIVPVGWPLLQPRNRAQCPALDQTCGFDVQVIGDRAGDRESIGPCISCNLNQSEPISVQPGWDPQCHDQAIKYPWENFGLNPSSEQYLDLFKLVYNACMANKDWALPYLPY